MYSLNANETQPKLIKNLIFVCKFTIDNVVAEFCWFHNLLLELYCPITKATLVCCDNISLRQSSSTSTH
ncbi:hypothetical protein MTR_2g088970 [Medicago truncatula]|uniref:Uncharacterized protein n=1 Tax=Medicago truncatula TaxID=3880 RepID=G7IKM0_MEDTR|nr:hypothetical protein MTR_2g088970 [Medicago truncatula]